jgi:hypothetical protein
MTAMPTVDLHPRFRIQHCDAAESRDAVIEAGLEDVPFDGRIPLVLATRGLLNSLAEVDPDVLALLAEDGRAPADCLRAAEVVLPSLEQVPPGRSVLTLLYNGHRLALLVVAQREGAAAPAPYLLPETCLALDGADVVCCAYVRVDHDGGTTVLLDGWVDGRRLGALPRQTRAGEKCRRIDVAKLRPMHELWLRLQATRRPTLLAYRRRFRRAARAGLRLLPAAAALLFAALWLWYPRMVTNVLIARYAGSPVVEWQVASRTLGMRAVTPTRVVRSGDEYAVNLRVLTGRRFGWIYQVDDRVANLLGRLEARPDGALVGEHRGVFDDLVGLEYFVLILSERDLPALSVGGPAAWLTRAQLREIQDFARRGEDDQAAGVLRTALERLGWQGTAEDLRLERIDHRQR